MRDMTPAEARSFLLEQPRTAKLATVRADGRPHVAPIWFVLDGDDWVFTTWHTTVKAANLLHDPRVSLCVDSAELPYAFVIAEGIAQVHQEAPDLLEFATRLARRYMGDALAEQYGRRNGVPGEWLVRVRPEKLIAKFGIAD